MTSQAQTDVVRLREAIALLLDNLSVFVNDQGIVPAVSSPARAEQAQFPHPPSVLTVCSQVNQLVEVAADHLSLFGKALAEPLETIAPWTCIRALLESSALALWLLDASIDVHKRVGRSLALRYEGMNQQLKFSRLVQPAAAQELVHQIEEVEARALSWGFAAIAAKGKRGGIGQRMPSATELVRLTLDEEPMYRLLSAVVHAHSWAVHQLGFRLIGDDENAMPPPEPGLRAMEKSVNVAGMALLGSLAAKVMGRVAWDQSRYFGWDRNRLRDVLTRPFDELGFPHSSRTWLRD
jgi:hypothetical protein